jgi:hypothetical protein
MLRGQLLKPPLSARVIEVERRIEQSAHAG